jgi:hypothetical protein
MAQEELEVEELDNILDSSWIDDFKRQDKEYERYYTDNIHKIKIHSIFININNDIIQIKEEKIKLKQPNYISREEIIGILKKNCINKGLRYSVLSILKYNIDIEPLDVQFYLANNQLQQSDNIFLTSIKNIDAIPLKKSISMFEDLNDLLIVFNEKTDETNIEQKHRQKCLTRKIYLLSKSLLGKHKKTARNMKNIIKTL